MCLNKKVLSRSTLFLCAKCVEINNRTCSFQQIGGGLSALSYTKKGSAETDDDDDDHPNTLILARKDDSYTLSQVVYLCTFG